MSDESGVPAADGVPPEENVDPPPDDLGTDDTPAVDAVPADEPVATEPDVVDEPPATDADMVDQPLATDADVADEPVAPDAIVVGAAAAGAASPPLPPTPPEPAPPPPPAAPPQATPGPPEQGIPRRYRVGLVGASLFGLLVLAVGASLVYILVKIWPSVPQASNAGGGGTGSGGSGNKIELFWGLFTFHLLPETALIVLTGVMGGIGATIFIAVSFGDYVGNRRFAKNWIWFYLVRFFVGPALALIFYFAVRGGFLATSASGTDINPYGIAALAGLVGLYSKRAGDKLKEVFDTLFQVSQDEARGDSITNPLPTIAGIEPPPTASAETLTFTLRGTGFIESSTVAVGWSPKDGSQPTLLQRDTIFVSETELEITLNTEDVAEGGVLWISVTNPTPGGGTAGPQAFDIT
jgi:hypothetical protein